MKIRLRGPLTKPPAAEGCLDPKMLVSRNGEQSNNELIAVLKTALAEADQCLIDRAGAAEQIGEREVADDGVDDEGNGEQE